MDFDPVRAAQVVMPQLEDAVRDAGGSYVAARGIEPRSWGYTGSDGFVVVLLDYVDWGVASAPARAGDAADQIAQDTLSWWRGTVQQLDLPAMVATSQVAREGSGTVAVDGVTLEALRYVSDELETFVAAVNADLLVAVIGSPTHPLELRSNA